MITLEPIGGLGNRMRAVDSALSLADTFTKTLRVIWTRTADCDCPFAAIFEPLRSVTMVERGWWANRLLRRMELWSGRYARVVRQTDMHRLRSEGGDFRALASGRSAFIQTFERFHQPVEPGFGRFVPVQSLRAEIDRTTSSFTDATVGVHVRRGDHALSHRHSPTSAFIERMAAEAARNPRAQFFVATDAPEVEAELRRHFGARILTSAKTFGRTSVPGIRGAVVDLYALARTTRILGSFHSSFSETAAEIGGLPLEIIECSHGS